MQPRSPRVRLIMASALPLALSALALPGAATAATAEVSSGQLVIRAGAEATANAMTLSQQPDGRVVIRDSAEPVTTGAGCSVVQGGAVCTGASRIFAGLGGGDDALAVTLSLSVQYNGGAGDDTLATGTGPGPSKVAFAGGDGRDTVTYAAATRGVTVNQNRVADDGRTGTDSDDIGDDVDVIIGSRFADSLAGFFSEPAPLTFDGLGGDDVLQGGGGNDNFRTAPGDGADRISGGGGFDTVDYRTRSRSLRVTVDAGGADDGEAGERDEVRSMEQILTGPGDDTVAGSPVTPISSNFVTGAGVDRITGTEGRDGVTPGPGRDIVDTRGGADIIRARDGEADTVACGAETDTLQADGGLDTLTTGCEIVERVGVLRLAARSLRVPAGDVARIRLSWTHPRAAGRLAAVTLRLRDGAVPVGEVVITSRAARMRATGAVALVPAAGRLRRDGRAVRATVGVRLDGSLAGRRLAIDVEAVDRAGRRQVERGAGALIVAG
ncbi:MAG: hypothetical protein AB7V62_14085 [Thermoleophilia bacterium]